MSWLPIGGGGTKGLCGALGKKNTTKQRCVVYTAKGKIYIFGIIWLEVVFTRNGHNWGQVWKNVKIYCWFWQFWCREGINWLRTRKILAFFTKWGYIVGSWQKMSINATHFYNCAIGGRNERGVGLNWANEVMHIFYNLQNAQSVRMKYANCTFVQMHI